MPLDDELVARAQGSDRQAMRELLELMYPAAHRIACGLSGREDVGRGVVHFVMRQAIVRLPRWRDGEEAERWMHHHTVLAVRRAAHHEASMKNDVLLGDGGEAAYAAFIRAMRALPMQQREAFVLHHGERLSARQLAVAMDCSTQAADLHLRLAQGTLEPLAGAEFGRMVERMKGAYQKLVPAVDAYRPAVRKLVARSLWPRRAAWMVRMIIAFALIVAGIWAWQKFGHLLPWADRSGAK